ncbi:MAG: class 3 adenylate cyclase [Gammaproteobacteria bacterium]|jgi:class 3 adenylate cyclase
MSDSASDVAAQGDATAQTSGTATMTVMFTDIADYTASVARSDREGIRRILAEHKAAVYPLVDRFGGRVVKNIGDSFLCLFPSATDALRASLEIQKVEPAEHKLTMRIALTTGDIEMIDGDAFGDSVNLAARILAKTPAGEVWFGAGTRACMNTAEVAWESIGWFRLKGVPGEQECFRVVPHNRVWLPHAILTAIENDKLVRIRNGSPAPALPPEPVILFEGFTPASHELGDAMDVLPVLDPASLFLSTYTIAPEDRQAWTEYASGLVIGMPLAIDEAIQEIEEPVHNTSEIYGLDGSDTLLLDRIVRTDLELVLCGLALPAVPLADVVAAYSYELTPDGHWVTRSDRAFLRVEVTPNKVVVLPLTNDISIAGAHARSGKPVELKIPTTILTPAGAVQYCPLKSGYIGVLLLDTNMKLGVKNGQTAQIGRKPNPPGLAFPNREGQDNIRWCSGPRASRARREDFSLDRVLAGRQQAAIKPQRGSIELHPLHDDCATYVLREGRIGRARRPVRVRTGDMIVAGTNVIALRAPE